MNSYHFPKYQPANNNNNNNNNNNKTTENSYIGHSTRTAESADVKAQKSLKLKTALYAQLTVRAV
jgi:hypothetical protein